jgi:hypothetical protein
MLVNRVALFAQQAYLDAGYLFECSEKTKAVAVEPA